MAPRTILRNVGSNSLGYVVNVVVGLALSRYVRESLGNVGNGIWVLVVCFVGYYGLFDVGIRSAVSHYVATYHARRDPTLVNRTLSTAMALLLGAAVIGFAVTLLVAHWLPDWLDAMNRLRVATGDEAIVASSDASLDPTGILRDQRQLRVAVLVMGAGFSLSLPMALFGTVLYSVQRLGLMNAISIGQVLLRAALTWLALRDGQGIVGLACVAVGCNVVAWIVSLFAARRALPELSFAFRHCARASARELGSYGGYNVLVNVGDTVLLYTSSIVILSVLHDAELITYYGVSGTQLVPYFMSLVQSVTWAFTPYFTGQWATGKVDEVRRTLGHGTRAVLFFASLVAGGLLFLGREFVSIWQGPTFTAAADRFDASIACLSILTVATLVRASQSTGRQALFAMREVRWLGVLVLIEAAANVALSVVLARRYGLVGVALGTLIPVFVTQAIVQPFHLLRELEMDLGRYALDSLRVCLPILAVMFAVDRLLGGHLAATSYPTFLARGVVVALPALLVGLFVGLDGEERRALLRRLRP
jgi:O-antigen/teichoic acid export membrane protein